MKTQIIHISKLQTSKVIRLHLHFPRRLDLQRRGRLGRRDRIHGVGARMKRFALAALAILLAPAALAVELSGAIRSSTGTLPAAIEVYGDRADKLPVIVGKVENGRYRIELPDAGLFQIRLKAPGWDAAPKTIWDPRAAGALDFLLYPAKVPEPALAAELTAMGKQDQAVRPDVKGSIDPETIKRMNEEDARRERRLEAIIAAKGWPTASMVGHEAAGSAWMIAQHASPAFLKRCVPLMQAAADKGEMAPSQLALSIDRDRMNDGKPQVYGSQLRWGTGAALELHPIEDRAHVDERRAAMGMEPLAQYLKRFEK
jgi:hypothetical protein